MSEDWRSSRVRRPAFRNQQLWVSVLTNQERCVRPLDLSFLQQSLEETAPIRADEYNWLCYEILHVTVPPIELQREFARRVRAVEKLKTAQRASLAELDALFASLQHRAFRGEL